VTNGHLTEISSIRYNTIPCFDTIASNATGRHLACMEPALYIHQGSLWRPGQGHVTATEFCQNNRHRSAIKTEEIGGFMLKLISEGQMVYFGV